MSVLALFAIKDIYMNPSAYSCPKRKERLSRTMFGHTRGIQHNGQGPRGSNVQVPRSRRYILNSMQVQRGNTTHKIVLNNKVENGKYFRYNHLNTSFTKLKKNNHS